MLSGSRFVRHAAITVLAIATSCALMLPTAGGAAVEAPKDTEIGVTAKEIRLAIVADNDNPIRPGLFKATVDGVNAAAKWLNTTGGIAGRKVVIDFYDSKLSPTEARNGYIKACVDDFMMVGNSAALVSSYDDVVNCKDKAGANTGVPDIPAIAIGPLVTCSPTSFPVIGSPIDCSTVNKTPQRYQGGIGASKYFMRTYGKKNGLTGPLVNTADTKQGAKGSTVLGMLAEEAGINIDETFLSSGRDPQSAYTPIVQAMKQRNNNYLQFGVAPEQAISLRQEAVLQGLDPASVLWVCAVACYDTKTVAAGQVMKDTHQSMNFLPFTEAKYNKTLAAFVKYIGENKLSAYAVYGFVSVLLAKQVADAVVKRDGVNGLTRASFLTEIKNTHRFDAGGMWAPMDPGTREQGSCFLVLNFDGSKFVREYPKKVGTFDCKPSNHQWIEADLPS